MASLDDIIDEALQSRLPNCPPELRDRIVELATPAARKAVRQAVIDVVKNADMTFAYQEVERFRSERQKRAAARAALREAAAELRERLDDDEDDFGTAALADRIAELGPRSLRPAPIELKPETV